MTVTLTVPVTVLYFVASSGVNFQPCAAVTAGEAVDVVKVKVPITEATPPLSVESAKV